MAVLSEVAHPNVAGFFKELPLYNKPIKKPKLNA